MTQAPTPGPLSGDWPVVTDKWVETYCDLTGRDPDGGSVTFLGDGPVSTSFRDAARREIEAMLCAAPKSAIRSLAPTAPLETLGETADDEEEAYRIGKRDGYEAAVQDIDHLTGGDGEYRVSADNPERHVPDAYAMKAKIVERFEALSTTQPDTGKVEASGVEREVCDRLSRLMLGERHDRIYGAGRAGELKMAKDVGALFNAADLALRPQPSGETREAVAAIAAERQRQIDAEGWSEDHDDEHPIGQLARAAGCYALSAGRDGSDDGFFDCVVDAAIHHSWPWDRSWWKPKDRRSDLVRAGALIVAEIERLDRLALITPAKGGGK